MHVPDVKQNPTESDLLSRPWCVKRWKWHFWFVGVERPIKCMNNDFLLNWPEWSGCVFPQTLESPFRILEVEEKSGCLSLPGCCILLQEGLLHYSRNRWTAHSVFSWAASKSIVTVKLKLIFCFQLKTFGFDIIKRKKCMWQDGDVSSCTYIWIACWSTF